MSRLFNNFFEIGHFPDQWKIAHITAVYKRSGSKTCKSSYRPISILPSISKVFESVMHDRLLKHCIENNVITEKQAAYLKWDSMVSQLLYIVHWTENKISPGIRPMGMLHLATPSLIYVSSIIFEIRTGLRNSSHGNPLLLDTS